MTIQDDLRQAVGERQGSAIRFTDIDGIGQKTAQSIKQSGRIRSPSDISDKTADELAEQAGISESRARKAIKGAGGDPDRTPRSTTGSVSAAGIKMPQGEFVTEVSDQDKAEAKVSTSLNRGIGRSQEAAAADKGKRAPVTTDYERWKKKKGELDFPGADTPTDDPQVLPKDLRQKQRPATTDPEDRSDTRKRRANNMAAPGQGVLLDEAAEAGIGSRDIADESVTAAAADRDVSLAPEEALYGDGAVGINTLGTFSPSSGRQGAPTVGMERPPDFERGEDPFDMSNDGGALDDTGSSFAPGPDERQAIRQLERNSPGREAEQIEKVRLYDDPPEDALATFGEAADRVVSNRDEITDPDRTDTTFFESDTIDTIDRLRSEVR